MVAKTDFTMAPKDASNSCKSRNQISYIYVQIKGGLKKEHISYLRQRKPLRQSRKLETNKRRTIPDLISIHQRPEESADRAVSGHWEGDLIIGKDHKPLVHWWNGVHGI